MFILCRGKVAGTPYKMPLTGQNVYSLEELCYYIYNNIYTVSENLFQKSLIDWLRSETDHPALAKKIEDLLEAGGKWKDLIMAVMSECDYYRAEERKKLSGVLDEIANLPVYKKKKMKADNYLRSGCYGKSLLEYRKLLSGSFAVNFTTEEYGDILHNQGIARFYTSSFAEAEQDFKEAYARNNSVDSIRHYLFLLLMQEKEELFEQEVISFGLAEEADAIRSQYREAVSRCRVPAEREGDLERYKQQLIQAFAWS